MSKKNILIVDDNPENLKVLSKILYEEGFTTRVAMDGKEAIESAFEMKPDLILLDIHMPILDGYETCKELKKNEQLRCVPVIFISAMTEVFNKVLAFKTGGADYITKPFEVEEVIARVNLQIDLKIAKEELILLNNNLEQKVEERTNQLNESNKSLSKALESLKVLDHAKSEFLGLISHEIRTPLNGVRGFLNIIKEELEDDRIMQLFNILDASTGRLERFCYDTLLITQLNTKLYSVESQEFKIKELFDSVLSIHASIRNDKNLSIDFTNFDDSLLVKTDRNLINEVVIRLLKNGCEYSNKNDVLRFSSFAKNDYTVISLQDNGKGFSSDFLSTKLTPFSPGEKHIDQNLGLDLYLSCQIMKYLNGKLEYGNNKGGGAFVNLYIPMDKL